jgi:hypothetical protein
MSSILDDLAGELTPQTIQRMGAQIGAAPQQTASAIETALPLLLGQLQRNAASPQGANALLGALDRDHDGSILDDLAGFLGQGPSSSDARSVDHIFGGKKGTVESAVARRSGLDAGQVMKLLAMLAPLVLGILGRRNRQGSSTSGGGLGDLIGGMLGGGGGATGGGGGGNILSDLLGGAMGKMQSQSPGLDGMLGGLLDKDGDGSIMDDLLEQGLGGAKRPAPSQQQGGDDPLGGLLGSLLGGKR